jgi:acyl-coenzyme A thioesterase PaaI-like protein
MTPLAFQDQMADNHCFGCGPLNPKGLQIKSYWEGDETVCTFQPKPEHAAGPEHWLNGGIIATVIDCHCVCTAVAWYYRQEGRDIGTTPGIWCVTGDLNVKYLRPTPIDHPVELRARIEQPGEKKLVVACTLTSEGKPRAEGRVTAVRVPPEWRADV